MKRSWSGSRIWTRSPRWRPWRRRWRRRRRVRWWVWAVWTRCPMWWGRGPRGCGGGGG
uniref:Uncharacterized protein n=1 Tax=Arundo donax TaxID=35708 RepID=A0A0A9HF73_ARUDO